jgi:hypothetical protein
MLGSLARRALAALRRALGGRPRVPVRDAAGLAEFVRTRSSYIAQTSLYGYLRTRAGTRFPELFDDDRFVASMNIAKWHVWLACVSDLALYAGGLVRTRSGAPPAAAAALMQGVIEEVLRETGVPAEAGPEFAAHAGRVRARLALCDWGALGDDDAAFVESPTALVHWAPVSEDFRQLDGAIVRNSVRYKWAEVRRELRELLDAGAVFASVAQAREGSAAPRANPGP